jgi:hypothetical protein
MDSVRRRGLVPVHNVTLKRISGVSTTLLFLTILGFPTTSHAQGVVPQTRVDSSESNEDSADLKGALQDSLRLLTIQHLTRIAFQEKTRTQLGGPFFGDYHRSVRLPRQWSDGDGRLTNYLGHPIQGAAAGFIWLDNASRTRAFSLEPGYWRSRLGAAAWATGYSLQFEVGLLSEASIGNVGMNSRTAGWVDHVVTPTGGFAMMIGEDAVDRFVIRRLEPHLRSSMARAVLRIGLNPSRTMSNVSALRAPWHRDGRSLRGQPTRP